MGKFFGKGIRKKGQKSLISVFRNKQNLILLIFIGLIILLKLPNFVDPPWHPDEGIYSSIVYQMDQGKLLYMDAWDNKPPGIFYIYDLFYKIFGFNINSIHILGLLSSIFAFIYFIKLFKKIIPNKSIILPSIIFIILLCSPLIDGNVVNAENIFLAFTTAGIYYFLSFLENSQYKFLYISFLLYGIAFTIKLHPIFEFFTLILAFVIYLITIKRKFNKNNFYKFLLGLLIFSLPYLLFILLFFIQGNLSSFIDSMFNHGVNYVQVSQENTFFLLSLINSLAFKTLALLIFTGLLIYKYYKDKKFISFIFYLLTLYILFAIFFSGREYAHYLIQGLSVFILTFSLFLYNFKNKSLKSRFVLTIVLIICLFSVPLIFFAENLINGKGESSNTASISYFKYVANYYPNYIKLISGNINKNQYDSMFYSNTDNFYKLVNENKNLQNTKTYLWDDYPWYYFINKVNDPVKYVTSFHLSQENVDLNNFITELNNKADYIVFNKQKYEELQENYRILLLQNFKFDRELTDYLVFRSVLL